MSKYKEDIIRLRKQGKSYREIQNELDCSKGTISHHCKKEGLENIGLSGGHGKNETVICSYCGTEFLAPVSRNRVYCSKNCYLESDKNDIDYSNCGGYREGSGVSKGCWYESSIAGKVWLDSSYELAYAKWLDENNVEWERNSKSFYYTHNGNEKEYIPDFEVEGSYVETKGFKTNLDESKWGQFPHKLEVLFKEDLLELGCDIQGAVDELA